MISLSPLPVPVRPVVIELESGEQICFASELDLSLWEIEEGYVEVVD